MSRKITVFCKFTCFTLYVIYFLKCLIKQSQTNNRVFVQKQFHRSVKYISELCLHIFFNNIVFLGIKSFLWFPTGQHRQNSGVSSLLSSYFSRSLTHKLYSSLHTFWVNRIHGEGHWLGITTLNLLPVKNFNFTLLNYKSGSIQNLNFRV